MQIYSKFCRNTMELNYQDLKMLSSKRYLWLFKMVPLVLGACLTIGTVTAEPNPWHQDQSYPEWSEIVRYQEPHEYQEDEAHTFGVEHKTTNHEIDGHLRKDYHPTEFHSDVLFPWVALIYGNLNWKSMSDNVEWMGHCGAVVINSNTLITICGCVASYVRWLEMLYIVRKDKESLDPNWPRFKRAPEAIPDLDIPVEDIFVFYGHHSEFFASQQDPNSKISKPSGYGNQEEHPQLPGNANFLCNQALKASRNIGKGRDFLQRRGFLQRTALAILNFDSVMNNQESHLPWPPIAPMYDDPINHKNTKHRLLDSLQAFHPSYLYGCCIYDKRGEQVVHSYVDNYGNAVYIEDLLAWRELSQVDLDECGDVSRCFKKSSNCEYEKKWHLLQDMTCYKSSYEPEICKGTVGSPLVTYNTIIGLATHVYTCYFPSTALVPVLALTPFLTNYIEYVLGHFGINSSVSDTSIESDVRFNIIRRAEMDYFKTYHLNEPEFYYDDAIPNEAVKDVNEFSRMMSASLAPYCSDHTLSWTALAFLMLNNYI